MQSAVIPSASTGDHSSVLPAIPRMLPDLRLALATLYSLPVDHFHPQLQKPSPSQAHDYLIFVQSRNARRRIISYHQQHRDSQNKNSQTAKAAASNDLIPMGSTWLACLALLCQVGTDHQFMASPTERLFAAQTLLHRLRRSKLIESIDIELEQSHDCDRDAALQFYQTDSHVVQLIPSYQAWIRQIHPGIVAQTVDSYHLPRHHSNASTPFTIQEEEQIKGELTLLTLAAVAFHDVSQSGSGAGGPLLSTTMAAMATLALKLRYSTSSNNPHAAPPIVSMLQHAFGAVAQGDRHPQAMRIARHVCLAALPDTVLAGGSRGRVSMDPKLIHAAIQDIRTTELPLVWQLLQESSGKGEDLWILRTCERWARCVPLPADFVHSILPLLERYLNNYSHSNEGKAAWAFLLAIIEGANWTAEEVVSSCLGLSDSQGSHQASRKRQSSRSKKKKQQVIERESSDDMYTQAEVEVRHRGDMACQAVMGTWNVLKAAVQEALVAYNGNTAVQVDGEGPVGCLSACANACLPHIIRFPDPRSIELFAAVTHEFQDICASPNRTVRAMALEPLYTLHKTMLEVVRIRGSLEEPLEGLAEDHFCKCALSLATSCGYPHDYFSHLGAPSDEGLEIERNDIRDVLRAITGCGESGSVSGAVSENGPLVLTTRILSKVLLSCNEVIAGASDRGELLPETVVHAFSSLAKPLNFIAKCCAYSGSSKEMNDLLELAIALLGSMSKHCTDAFRRGVPGKQLLPVSRIVDIAVASFSPMLSARCQQGTLDHSILHPMIEASILSIENLPELAVPSTLKQTQYDVRGTMRGPGGEDHVGCLALMRLSTDSPGLSQAMTVAIVPFVPRLCDLYKKLKTIENERGFGVSHGSGIASVSRRILLGVLCDLEVSSHGQTGAAPLLERLFKTAVVSIASFEGRNGLHEKCLAQIAECLLDLTYFAPSIVSSLFTSGPGNTEYTICVETFTNACLAGYHDFSLTSTFTDATLQWNRVRAAIFQLLQAASKQRMPLRATEIACALALAECEAIQQQCSKGPHSSSSLFLDGIISVDSVPAGIYVRVLGEALLGEGKVVNENCLQALLKCREPVLSVITHACPDPDQFEDPRPFLSEAWLYAMAELTNAATLDQVAELLLVDTCVSAISVMLFPSIGKLDDRQQSDPGMRLDGPHSLASMSFLTQFFQIGPQALQAVAQKLLSVVPVDLPSLQTVCSDSTFCGLAILGSALFRATQGALPPWVVDSIPTLYSSLYAAVGKEPTRFGQMMQLSMMARLSPSVEKFWGVRAGQLLSGPYFESSSDKYKSDFLRQVTELSEKDDSASWRRVKVLIKQACGGKKKDADFKQKPAQTRWDFVRI